MKFFRHSNRFFTLLAGLGLVLGGLLTGCAGSSDGGGSPGGGETHTGTVAVLLTDAPSDDFSQVNVTVTEISILSNQGGQVTIFSGSRPINLLELEDVEDLFTIHEGVQAGTYNKIRLHVSAPEFVKTDGTSITSEHIDLVADGKIDLVPRNPFQVLTGETLTIRLDLDVEKSIMIHPTQAGKYLLRPVVFVEILGITELPKRLISVSGVIESIDPETRSLLLRRTDPIFHDLGDGSGDRLRLIRVVVPEGTSIFEASGMPGNFGSLAKDQEIHVRGQLSLEGGLHIEAQLIEIGDDFIRLHGSIIVGVDDSVCDRFIIRLDSVQVAIPVPEPQSIQSGVPLPITEVNIEVQLHDETLIFEAGTHKRLTCVDLITGKRVLVEGVLGHLGDPTGDLIIGILHAAVIAVKPDLTSLEGTLFDPKPENRTFSLTPRCPSGLVCTQEVILVQVVPGGVIIRVSLIQDDHVRIEPIPFESLMDGDQAHVFGYFDGSGTPFHALEVITFSTQPIP